MAAALPPLPAVRAFDAAARLGSFTRAGEELGMTQAAISYQIKVLEDRVGAPLFLRRARGVALTTDGARLALRTGEALDILREAFAEARKESAGTLTISALATFATRILAPRLGAFQIAHPEISTRVDIFHGEHDGPADGAGVTICFNEGPWPGYHVEKLLDLTFTPLVGATFLARHGPITRPEDLLHLPKVDVCAPKWARWFEAAGLAVTAPLPLPPDHHAIQMFEAEAVLAGQGASLLSPVYFRDLLARGDLVQPFPIEIGKEEDSLVMVIPESRRNAPAIRAFRRWLLAEMAALAAPSA